MILLGNESAVCRGSLLADGSSYIITKFSAHKSLRSGKLYFYDDFLLLGMHFNTQANIKLAVFSPRKIYECHGSAGLMRDARVGDPGQFSLWENILQNSYELRNIVQVDTFGWFYEESKFTMKSFTQAIKYFCSRPIRSNKLARTDSKLCVRAFGDGAMSTARRWDGKWIFPKTTLWAD